MIDQNKVHEIIEERKRLHPDDPRIVEIWEELTIVFSKNEENTITFLNNCNEEYLIWISEIFEDISERLHSIHFLQCIEYLNEKYTKLCLGNDIFYAEKAFKTKN